MVPMTGNKLSASPEAMARVASVYTPMGITAENVAKRFNISREAQDEFALWSQQKAAAAREAKRFEDEIVTVTGIRYDGNEQEGPSTSATTSSFDPRRRPKGSRR